MFNLSKLWGSLQFSEDGYYYIYPMTSDDSNYVLRIPTLNGASNYYVAYVKNGKITLTLNTPEIAITSCTCDNSDPNNLKQSDKLVLRATFKNTGAAHTLKTRLAIGTINESGKFGSIYRGPEKSTYISSNGQVTIVHEYNLTNVTPGSYVTTILWYEDWADGDNNGWYYNTTVPLKWTNRSLK